MKILYSGVMACCMTLLGFSCLALDDIGRVGAGGLRLNQSSGDRVVPDAPFRTPAMLQRAAPTNQWYSSVMYTRWSEVLHAHPLTARASPKGLELGLPQKTVLPTARLDVEIDYPHVADLTVGPTAFQPEAALLAGHGDWSVDIGFDGQGQSMQATLSHGSPFVYFQFSQGDAQIQLFDGLTAQVLPDQTQVLRVSGQGKHYAVFAPIGAQWQQARSNLWVVHLPIGKGYLSAAVLPDTSETTFDTYRRSAFAFVVNTRANYKVDRNSSTVSTQFETVTKSMDGVAANPIIGLYPHHYFQNASLPSSTLGELRSIRGPIRFFQAKNFSTTARYNGFVPSWPGVQSEPARKDIGAHLSKEASRARRMMLEIGNGPYWQGKGLQRITQLMAVAESQGEMALRDQLLRLTEQRAQEWLSGESKRTYFHYSPNIGTVVAYPEEYDSVTDMNDHHFHYGYWIRAAAEIGLRNPKWVQSQHWGGMVDRLVADIATSERGRKDFPYLRNFDPYEGHSWASGTGMSPHGNNQESSSEATNAWAGLILWGELQGRPDLTDLGIYLYTTEIQSINHYWFDIHRLTLPADYMHAEVSMLFGGKLAHNTWWIDEPRQIHGINLLPLTTSSMYLAQDPAFVRRNLATREVDIKVYEGRGKKAKPADIWQDLFAQYLSLVDPVAGLKQWDPWGSVELGDTRSHALHFMHFLSQVGVPDLSVTANLPLHAVFRQSNGALTYLAYNPSNSPVQVRFSDGTVLDAPPNQTVRFLRTSK